MDESTSNTFNILVTNIAPTVTVDALTTFFSFTGNVTEVRISDGEDGTKKAIVSFDNEESVKTAELMTGATLEGKRIVIEQTTLKQATEDDQIFRGDDLPQRTIPELPPQHTKTSVAASLLAQGYVLASDTFQKAVAFDKTHNITGTIKAGATKVKEKVIEVDEQLHITEYLALGAAYCKSIITSVDEKLKISSTVSNAFSTATGKIDETLHVSEGYQACKSAVDNGIERVKNSSPVVSLRTSTHNFKEDIKHEIEKKRPPKIESMQIEDVPPFEINEEEIQMNATTEQAKEEDSQQLLDIPPPIDNEEINDVIESAVSQQPSSLL